MPEHDISFENNASHVFPRRFQPPLPLAVGAGGAYITMKDNQKIFDASGGPLVVGIGHGRPEIARAVHDQILSIDYVHPTMYTTGPVEQLAGRLSEKTPEGLNRFYFMSSGSEAVETAIKLARQVHLARGEKEKFRLIARKNAYHGLTMGALAASSRTHFRKPFAPMLPESTHIPAPYCYRCHYGLSHPGCGLRCARALEDAILYHGPETVSTFIAETVSGASLVQPPPDGYFEKIREICDTYGVFLILDEVLCGVGRCGAFFAAGLYHITPDFMTAGKGLSGGAVPFSAVAVKEDHYQAVARGQGFAHGGTFSHHSVGAAAALAAMDIMEKEDLVQRAAGIGERLKPRLTAFKNHPHVGDVRGIGCLWGVELVKEKGSKTPFAREEKVVEKLWRSLFDNGVQAYTGTGMAGKDGDLLVLGPPFISTDDDLDLMVDACEKALREVVGK